jgi:putative ABC transport system ATP-binding protein
MSGLRSAQEGSLKILGQEILGAKKQDLTRLRSNIGYIFQAHNLLTFLTAKQNVRMSLELRDDKYKGQNIDELAADMLKAVGLGERIDYYVCKRICHQPIGRLLNY